VWIEVPLEQAPPSPNHKALTKPLALSLVEGGLLAEGEPAYPKLLVKSGVDQDRTLELTRFDTPYVLGRSKRCDLPLEDDDASRRHVEVVRRGLGVWVRDLGSKNGSSLGDTPLSDEPVTWTPGAVLKLGKTELGLSDPVTSTLWEIEAGEDEVVKGEVEPPGPVEPPLEPSAPNPRSKSRKRGDVAQPPAKRRSEPALEKSPSVAVDVGILLLAVLMLTVSALALWWLM
jgi:hypothetical protein